MSGFVDKQAHDFNKTMRECDMLYFANQFRKIYTFACRWQHTPELNLHKLRFLYTQEFFQRSAGAHDMQNTIKE